MGNFAREGTTLSELTHLMAGGTELEQLQHELEPMMALNDGTSETIAPFPAEAVCGLGSGDAFGGAFCHGLLKGWHWICTVEYENAAGAIVANRLMCADDMPTLAEIDDFLASQLSTGSRRAT